MPPCIPGLRIKELFESRLAATGVRLLLQKTVRSVERGASGDFVLHVAGGDMAHKLRSRAVVLASGRFLGGGLRAYRGKVAETLFDLPVRQPSGRFRWHRRDFLDPRGHPVNQAGLEIDDLFRPLDRSGKPARRLLFAAGSILAHQDWMRMKCGSGLAIATAHAAVAGYLALR
jgi:glycerol-3-phosphate dehydrogenase subunit B